MQIICPNCGSKSPIEAGSLATQTRIVCARCANEFSAELSDEQAVFAPSPLADERGIELFGTTEFAPDFQSRPLPVMEVAAGPAHEARTAAEVSPVAEVAPAAEIEPATQVSPVNPAGDLYEVLSLPEELVLSNDSAAMAGVAGADQSAVLEDVFAAWNQSRESRPEADTTSTESAGAAEDYVTSPLPPNNENLLREEHRPEAESAECPSAEVLDSATAKAVAESAEKAPRTDDDKREPSATAAFADVPPQVAAAQSFDMYDLGVRMMRVSPLWLLVSGLSFVSFVVFCNWFFVPANLAQAGATRPASRRNEATNRSLISAATADAATARPDSRNSNTSRPALPAEAEVVSASVKVEEPKTAPSQPPATPAASANPTAMPSAEQPKAAEVIAPRPAPAGKFTVQVGSYNVPAEADARAASLRSAGQAVRVAEVEIPKRGKWYRVYVGGFGSRGEAESHGKSLRERGLAESYIATEAQ